MRCNATIVQCVKCLQERAKEMREMEPEQRALMPSHALRIPPAEANYVVKGTALCRGHALEEEL